MVTIPKPQCYNEAKFLKWCLANTEHMTCEALTISTLSICCYVQSLNRVLLSVTPWTVACQASLPFTISRTCSHSCPLSPWCHQTILSSVEPISSCLQSHPESRSFPWTLLIPNTEHTAGPQNDWANIRLPLQILEKEPTSKQLIHSLLINTSPFEECQMNIVHGLDSLLTTQLPRVSWIFFFSFKGQIILWDTNLDCIFL